MYISIFLIIFLIISYSLIYKFRHKISTYFKVIDYPNEKRKIHKQPTPKTGSYSLALVFFTILILNIFFNIFDSLYNLTLIGSLSIFIIGFLDDKYNLSASKKTILISFVTFVLCKYSGYLIIDKFYLFHLDFFFKLENFSIFFTILCVLALVNSLNLADGINGLAIGIIFSWLIHISYMYNHNLQPLIYLILINLLITFYHNLKGDHFLGDSGSLMLSSFIAFLIITLHNENKYDPSHINSAETILILFIVPILDMLRLFFERLIKRKSPVSADNNHLHHILSRNFSIIKSLLIYFILINIPILISIHTSISKYYIIFSIIFLYIIIIFYYKNNFKV